MLKSSAPRRIIYRDEGLDPSEDTVEFRLTWQGKLLSTRTWVDTGSGVKKEKTAHKHDIRRHFHTQLARYWEIEPTLARKLWVAPVDQGPAIVEQLADKYRSNNFRWVPLVIQGQHLNCSLDILYLRNGLRGAVLTNADIDNRVKTLIDALKMPKHGEIDASEKPGPNEDPFYVLLEDDVLVTHLSVTSDSLLDPTDPSLGDTDSRVVVTVKIWQS